MFGTVRQRLKIVLPAILAVTLVAQTPQPNHGRLVEVNVVVRDKSGPVGDLKASDFTLFDKGKEQKIAGVLKVDTHVAPQPMAPNVFSNHPTEEGVGGSITAILLDGVNSNGSDQSYMRQQFARVLAELKPTDPVVIFTLGSRMRVLTDVAAHIAGGQKAAEEWLGELGINQGLNIQARVTSAVEALVMISNSIGHLPGRKNLIWVAGSYPVSVDHKGSEGPPGFEDAAMSNTKVKLVGGTNPNVSDANQINRQVFAKMWDPAMQALSLNNVAVYALDAHGTIDLAAASGSQQSNTPVGSLTPTGVLPLRTLAEDTGGRAFESGLDPTKAIRRALDDAEVTYTLSYYPDAKALDKNFHDLKVTVSRGDTTTFYRKGYLAIAEPKLSDPEKTNSIKSALLNPVNSSAIGLMAGFEKADQPKPGTFKTQVVINAADLDLKQEGESYTGGVELFVAARTADGKDAGNARQPIGLKLNAQQYDQVMKQGLSLTKNLETTGAVTEIRAVVADRTTGKVGSLIMPVK